MEKLGLGQIGHQNEWFNGGERPRISPARAWKLSLADVRPVGTRLPKNTLFQLYL
jgi:hypothetical protein